MLKIEHLNQFAGFGGSERDDEYYFSMGMRMVGRGIEPRWVMTEAAKSSTVTNLDLITAFAERLEGANNQQLYSVDEGGDIFKVTDSLSGIAANWSRVQNPGTSNSGNGLITGHGSSQRLLYAQNQYLGSYDGSVWYDTFKDFGTSQNINRDSDIYEDWVVFGNGSTVATLNVTDDTWNNQALTFPADFVVRAVKSGKNGILIGVNFNEKGILVLWDAQADRSIAPWIWTDGIIRAIAKYQGIWIVATSREFILTNGYNIIKRYTPPDITDGTTNFGPTYPTGMIVDKDKLLVLSATGSMNRFKKGLYILDLITGLWEFCPFSNWNVYSNSSDGALFKSTRNKKYAAYRDSFIVPYQEYVGIISDGKNTSYFISAEIGSRSNRRKKAEAIILDLGFALRNSDVNDDPDWKITAKVYNFQRQLWAYGQASSTSASVNSIPVDGTQGTYNQAEVGDEITILEGENAGEVRHITVIDRQDAANELWTLDKSLAQAIEVNALISVIPFRKVGTKNVNSEDIKNNRLYIPIQKTITGRKFLLKLIVEPTNMIPRINNLWFVYDELDYK